jgi:hypothetical protein
MAIKVMIARGAACEVMVAACWFLLVRGLDEVAMKVAQECKAETGNCKVHTRPLAKGALPCTVHMQCPMWQQGLREATLQQLSHDASHERWLIDTTALPWEHHQWTGMKCSLVALVAYQQGLSWAQGLLSAGRYGKQQPSLKVPCCSSTRYPFRATTDPLSVCCSVSSSVWTVRCRSPRLRAV